MSMDHNYARGKLTLLLRDLSNYNADEFWREMSRIASGATASIHAEGLKAERDALADSNTQLKQQNEAQISLNAKLMHERDALAAKVELTIEALDHRPSLQATHFSKLLVHLRQANTASLAHHDAELIAAIMGDISSEALKAHAKGLEYTSDMAYALLSRQCHEKRKEAEGHQ